MTATLADVLDILGRRMVEDCMTTGGAVAMLHEWATGIPNQSGAAALGDALFEISAMVEEEMPGVALNAYDGREFRCSACDSHWHMLYRTSPLDEWEHVRTPGFCPSCGARVVAG